jgi:hypothetical protein
LLFLRGESLARCARPVSASSFAPSDVAMASVIGHVELGSLKLLLQPTALPAEELAAHFAVSCRVLAN